jgi:cbb3-type cytochrome oxidase subunit 3
MICFLFVASVSIEKTYLSAAGIVALIALLLLVILAVVAYIFYRKKKEFEIKYMKLVNDREQGETSLELTTR